MATSSITVSILGTNDAAITPATTTRPMWHYTSGTMVITDVDSATTFTALTAVAGSNSYGTFSMTTAGVWTYTASAMTEFSLGRHHLHRCSQCDQCRWHHQQHHGEHPRHQRCRSDHPGHRDADGDQSSADHQWHHGHQRCR
ncbi:MAG: hypothetical protein IPP41_04855 [Rhodocyclaceae bacterium]|nr:hypothetical protein [Rhodocyclaceae bacterium]